MMVHNQTTMMKIGPWTRHKNSFRRTQLLKRMRSRLYRILCNYSAIVTCQAHIGIQ